jgi:small subunit ribosomal protein S2
MGKIKTQEEKTMSTLAVRDLFKAGIHFGHQTRCWNPKMAPYIFGSRDKIHIINLDKTLPLLQEALNFIGKVAAKKGKILFVGTKLAARDVIKDVAERCHMPYVNHRWLGGMLTNYKTVRHSIKRLQALEKQFAEQAFGNLTKKEILHLTREKDKLELNLGGIKQMGGLPDALFIIDTGCESIAIKEANKLKIPVIGVVDTNNDPESVDYLIPGNDDAARAIEFYLNAIADSILHAQTMMGIDLSAGKAEDEFVEVAAGEIEEEVVEKKPKPKSKPKKPLPKKEAAEKPKSVTSVPKKEVSEKPKQKKPSSKKEAAEKPKSKKPAAKITKKTTKKKEGEK